MCFIQLKYAINLVSRKSDIVVNCLLLQYKPKPKRIFDTNHQPGLNFSFCSELIAFCFVHLSAAFELASLQIQSMCIGHVQRLCA